MTEDQKIELHNYYIFLCKREIIYRNMIGLPEIPQHKTKDININPCKHLRSFERRKGIRRNEIHS